MTKKYVVDLTEAEREELNELTGKNKGNRAKIINAFVLLKADRGGDNWKDAQISAAFNVSVRKIERIRQRFVEEGFEAGLSRKSVDRSHRRKIQGEEEARLITLCCSSAPEGKARWTLRLLADKLVELELVESVCPETVRQTLKKMN
jgi:transposase